MTCTAYIRRHNVDQFYPLAKLIIRAYMRCIALPHYLSLACIKIKAVKRIREKKEWNEKITGIFKNSILS